MSRSLLHDWEYAIDKCCREANYTGMISIAEDIYNTAYVRGKNHSDVAEALDEIKAKIEKLEYLSIEDGSDGYDKYIDQYEVSKIINEYRAESEE